MNRMKFLYLTLSLVVVSIVFGSGLHNVRALDGDDTQVDFTVSDLFSFDLGENDSLVQSVKIRASSQYSSLFHEENTQIVWTRFEPSDFSVSAGDYFLVDIENAQGYLINENSRFYTVFPIMTGAKRTPTPVKDWVVLEENIKSDRITFDDSGEFFRMFLNDGATRTGYGIHGYAYFDFEIANGRKFLSLGCVLVSDANLDLIEESFIANGNRLNVYTRESVDIEAYFNGLIY
ncbi:MAG: L,D-transpeptidase [Candidatus Gracilibacteria bacterium]|nr:L,D-transpeptidase [Candidatus Gracilibacteria bacterium]